MSAASAGSLRAVKALLVRGANVNAVESWKGQTALMWAAAEGHAAVVDALDRIGRRRATHVRKRASRRCCSRFARALSPPCAACVKAKANVNDIAKAAAISSNSTARPVSDATSALAMAVINAHFDVAGLLVENGADPNAPDARGSILHALAWIRKPGAAGGDQAPPSSSGSLSSLELAEALLKHGANPNVRIAWQEIPFDRDDGEVKSPPNIRVGRDYISLVGATPFYLAAKNGDVELMRLLVEARRRPAADDSSERDAADGSGRVRDVGWRNTRTIERNT